MHHLPYLLKLASTFPLAEDLPLLNKPIRGLACPFCLSYNQGSANRDEETDLV